jgi:hypothetical protein
MAESQLPKNWEEARNVILGNLPWILLLTGVDLLFHEQWYPGVAAMLGCVLSLVLAIYWGVFKNIGKDPDRRRRLITWSLILAGAALLVWGIFRLGAQTGFQSANSSSELSRLETELADTKAELNAQRQQREILDRQLASTRRELQEAQDALNSLQLRTRVSAPTPPRASTEGKQFTDKTVRQLRALYEGRTALQAKVFMADEVGKLIDVEGKIVRIDDGMAFLDVGPMSGDSVECRFDSHWNPKLATFRNGERMKIRGTIGPNQNGAQIYLQKCEVLN